MTCMKRCLIDVYRSKSAYPPSSEPCPVTLTFLIYCYKSMWWCTWTKPWSTSLCTVYQGMAGSAVNLTDVPLCQTYGEEPHFSSLWKITTPLDQWQKCQIYIKILKCIFLMNDQQWDNLQVRVIYLGWIINDILTMPIWYVPNEWWKLVFAKT
jgi:hypothetical protein